MRPTPALAREVRQDRPAPAGVILQDVVPVHADPVVLHRQAARRAELAAGGPNPLPDPRANYVRATPFGLSVSEGRTEWSRCASAGWRRWELDVRLLPGPVADLSGVAAAPGHGGVAE